MNQLQNNGLSQIAYLLLRQKGYQVPQNILNDPNAIIQHLLNTGQVTQDQYNVAASRAKHEQNRF